MQLLAHIKFENIVETFKRGAPLFNNERADQIPLIIAVKIFNKITV